MAFPGKAPPFEKKGKGKAKAKPKKGAKLAPGKAAADDGKSLPPWMKGKK